MWLMEEDREEIAPLISDPCYLLMAAEGFDKTPVSNPMELMFRNQVVLRTQLQSGDANFAVGASLVSKFDNKRARRTIRLMLKQEKSITDITAALLKMSFDITDITDLLLEETQGER